MQPVVPSFMPPGAPGGMKPGTGVKSSGLRAPDAQLFVRQYRETTGEGFEPLFLSYRPYSTQ